MKGKSANSASGRFGLKHRRIQLLEAAFFCAAHSFFVAAMIRARPSGLRRRFFLAAVAGVGGAAVGFRAAAHPLLCGAVVRRRAAGIAMRLNAAAASEAMV